MGFPDLCEWWTPERIEDEDLRWQSERRYIEYANAIRTVTKKKKDDVVTIGEFGCGMGYVGAALRADKHLAYNGYDGSALMIEAARKKHPDLRLNVADIRQFKTAPFDLVCAFAVLKHFGLAHWEQVLRNMLSHGNTALIQVQTLKGTAQSVDSPVPNQPDVHHTWINESEMTAAFNAAGFEVVNSLAVRDVSQYMTGGVEWLLHARRK